MNGLKQEPSKETKSQKNMPELKEVKLPCKG